jgi:hypothetical protein
MIPDSEFPRVLFISARLSNPGFEVVNISSFLSAFLRAMEKHESLSLRSRGERQCVSVLSVVFHVYAIEGPVWRYVSTPFRLLVRKEWEGRNKIV